LIRVYAIASEGRRDDAIAARVLETLGTGHWQAATLPELTSALVPEVAKADCVVFIDVDYRPGEVRLESVSAGACCPGNLSHGLRPCDLISLTRRLHGFHGEAWLCKIPGEDFSSGNGLSETASRNAGQAVKILRELLAS